MRQSITVPYDFAKQRSSVSHAHSAERFDCLYAQKNITQENIAANPGRGGIWFVLLEHLLAEVYTE